MTSTAPIDHLSRLPPELLQTIFDMAHDAEMYGFPPRHEPVSKYLLPFTLAAFYRNFRPCNWAQLHHIGRSSFAPRVRSLMFIYIDEINHSPIGDSTLAPFINLRKILGPSTNDRVVEFFWAQVDQHPQIFRRVSSLDCHLNERTFGSLQNFASLQKLECEINFDKAELSTTPRLVLPHVISLRLDFFRRPRWTPQSVVEVISWCPALKSLRIQSVGRIFRPAAFNMFPSQLTSLYMECARLHRSSSFSHLPHLTSLELDRFKQPLANALVEHGRIRDLTLRGTRDLIAVLENLFDGVNRLPTLRYLQLEFEAYDDLEGEAIDYSQLPMFLSEMPLWFKEWFEGWPVDHRKRAEKIASTIRSHGIQVFSGLSDVTSGQELFLVEYNNRSVIKAYYTGDYTDLLDAHDLADEYEYSILPVFAVPPPYDSPVRIVKIVDRWGKCCLGLEVYKKEEGENGIGFGEERELEEKETMADVAFAEGGEAGGNEGEKVE